MNILIIDDDELMTNAYRRNFQSHNITTFNKPDDGFAYFLQSVNNHTVPDIVILDAVYAGQWAIPTGYDMAKKMRENDSKVAIIMVTANKRALDDLRINEQGVDAIFYKGEIDAPVLVAEIEKIYLQKGN